MSTSPSADLRLRLTPQQRRALEALAAREQISIEEAILRAVEHVLATTPSAPDKTSATGSAFPEGTPFHGLDGLMAAIGDGPADLSTNRDYLDDLDV